MKDAQILLIIGYGGNDSEINKMLFKNFDYKNKRSFIVDLFAGGKVQKLAAKLNSTIIKIEDIEAVACAVQNIYLSVTAYGLGGCRTTGGTTYI